MGMTWMGYLSRIAGMSGRYSDPVNDICSADGQVI